MSKIIKFNKIVDEKHIPTNQEYSPEKTKKFNPGILYNYHSNLMICEKLFLVDTTEFPSVEELELLSIGEARKIIRQLNRIFEEKAEKRHIKLTGKTMARAAVNKLDVLFTLAGGKNE